MLPGSMEVTANVPRSALRIALIKSVSATRKSSTSEPLPSTVLKSPSSAKAVGKFKAGGLADVAALEDGCCPSEVSEPVVLGVTVVMLLPLLLARDVAAGVEVLPSVAFPLDVEALDDTVGSPLVALGVSV